MKTVLVWAPDARRVELVTTEKRVAMRRGDDGWWVSEPGYEPGDYAFAVDGAEAVPDPRSAWQPRGVHGPSRSVDHAAFPWSDARWRAPLLSSGVIYELHVGTFTPEGTFEAAIARLEHLCALGITHVELMPVAEFAGRHGWGYDCVDLYAPHHAYGGPLGFKRFVDACHARGLAVLLDVVYNHLGPEGNYLARFGPYFTDRYTTPWGAAVNLDGAGSDEVRRFLCDNALMWLRDYHCDGLRVDAVHAFHDRSAVHFLEQLAREVSGLERRLGRPLVLIAESDQNDPRIVRPHEAGGYGLDAQWSDDIHHALHASLTGESAGYYSDFGSLDDLAKALRSGVVYDGRYSRRRGRRHGRPASDLPPQRLVAYLQNHDQVGNRARGERLCHLIGVERVKLAASLLLCAPFVPLIFQGEEWGASSPFLFFTDYADPLRAGAIRADRCREFAEFGWDPLEVPDPQLPETFARSKLDWRERTRSPHRELLAWYRALLALRREHPELCDDAVRVEFDAAERWLAMWRGSVLVAANLAPRTQRVRADVPLRPLLASSPAVRLVEGGVELPPDGVAILRIRASTDGEIQ